MKRLKVKTIFFDVLKVIKNSFRSFGNNRPVQLAGTTAYFAIFSTAPIILIIISIFGFITGNSAVREQLFTEIERTVGSDSAELLQNAIDNYRIVENSTLGTIVGAIIFVVSATALFSELQNSINYIWRVKVKGNLKVSLLNVLRQRAFSFAVIFALGILLLASLIVDASINILNEFLVSRFGEHFVFLAQTINLAVSLAIVAIVTAFVYRYLPDIHVNWSAAWFGAAVTSVLFAIGRWVIGTILSRSEMGVIYGTAGSIVVILIWVFFVSIIFYFGVELTHQFSLYYGHDNRPRSYAGTFEIHSVE